jgi:hypothetical protein
MMPTVTFVNWCVCVCVYIYINFKNHTVIWPLAIKRLEAYGLWVYYKKTFSTVAHLLCHY